MPNCYSTVRVVRSEAALFSFLALIRGRALSLLQKSEGRLRQAGYVRGQSRTRRLSLVATPQ